MPYAFPKNVQSRANASSEIVAKCAVARSKPRLRHVSQTLAAKMLPSKISPHMSACPRAILLNPFLSLPKKLYKRYNILFYIFKCRVDGLPDKGTRSL